MWCNILILFVNYLEHVCIVYFVFYDLLYILFPLSLNFVYSICVCVCMYVCMCILCMYMHVCVDACLQWQKLPFCSRAHYSGTSFVQLHSVHILGLIEKRNSFVLPCNLLKWWVTSPLLKPWALGCERHSRFLRLGLQCCEKSLELNQFIPVALFSGLKGCIEFISPPLPPPPLPHHPFSLTALQSNMDLHLLAGLLPFSSVFWPLFPIWNISFTNICLYTIPPSVVWSSSWLTSLMITVKYLTYFSFTIHSVNMTNPIQPTYFDKWKYI